MSDDDRTAQIAHENKMMRRLRFLVELTFATIAQDDTMTLEEIFVANVHSRRERLTA